MQLINLKWQKFDPYQIDRGIFITFIKNDSHKHFLRNLPLAITQEIKSLTL